MLYNILTDLYNIIRTFKLLQIYFINNFLNNPRFRNYSNSLTRFFFESNTKVRTSLTLLGDTFRNASWADLKIQNVKISLTYQYLNILVFSIVVLTIYFPLHYLNIYWFYWVLYNDLVGDIVTSIHCYITILFFNIVSAKLITLNDSMATDTRGVNTNNIIESFVNNQPCLSGISYNHNLLKNLYMSLNIISFFKSNDIINIYTKPTNTLKPSYTLFDKSSIPQHLTNFRCYESTSVDKSTFINTNINLVVTNVNKMGQVPTTYTLLMELMNSSLMQSKQERWLLKNSLISYHTIFNNTRINHSKRIIAPSNLNPHFSDSNLWASLTTDVNGLDLQTGVVTPDKTLLNSFSVFEESREFLTKRYAFLVNANILNLSKNLLIGSIHSTPIVELNLSNNSMHQVFNNHLQSKLITLVPTNLSFKGSSTKLEVLNLNTNSDYVLGGVTNEVYELDLPAHYNILLNYTDQLDANTTYSLFY